MKALWQPFLSDYKNSVDCPEMSQGIVAAPDLGLSVSFAYVIMLSSSGESAF